MELLGPVVRQEDPGEQVFGMAVASHTPAASQPHHQPRGMVLVGLRCPRATQSSVTPLLPLVLEETPASWCTRIKDGNDIYNTH